MDTPEKMNINSPLEGQVPGGIFNTDFISQMANALYREGIVDPSPDAANMSGENRIPAQENVPSDLNSSITNSENINRKESPNQGERMSSAMHQTRQPENHAFLPEMTRTSEPPRRVMPAETDWYFLNQTPEADQNLSAQNSGIQNAQVQDSQMIPGQNHLQFSTEAIDPFGISSGSFLKEYGQLSEMKVEPAATDDSVLYFEKPAEDSFRNCYYFQQYQHQYPNTVSEKDAEVESKPAVKPTREANDAEVETNADWSKYRMFNPEYVRKDFPVLQQKINGKPLVWLDNGATTQKPQSVIDALNDFYSNYNSNIHRGAHTLAARATDAYEDTRQKIADLIGAESKDEIIYVRGTTEGINLLANTFGRQRIGPGDEILVSELEHHANIVPWQLLAKEKGATLRMIPINDRGDIMLGAYERLFNQNTKLVAVGQVSNALGTVVPVKEMIAVAHRYGVPVVVDGAQSVQHMPVNVQELDADFFVFSGHKIFAPTGIGAVYGKRKHLEKMPPWQGGGNMIDQVTFEETTYNGVPALFEAGTPSIGDAIGLGAAIDYVQNIGMENIHRYESELMEYMVKSLEDIPGLNIIANPTHRAGALSFVMDDIPTETMGQLLDKEGIAVRSGHHCAQPALRHFGYTGSVRPSIAFYNTKGDIDRLREAILKII